MFKYSIDGLIASRQKQKAQELLKEISIDTHSILHYRFTELEDLFDSNVKSYDFIEKLHEVALASGDLIVMPIIPRESNKWAAQIDMKKAYDKVNKSPGATIPYIEFSFPDGTGYYKHGYDFQHVYIFFFTPLSFEESCDCVMHYFLKLNNLKAFL